MTQEGDFSLTPAGPTQAQANRISTQLDRFLTDSSMSEASEEEALNGLAGEPNPAMPLVGAASLAPPTNTPAPQSIPTAPTPEPLAEPLDAATVLAEGFGHDTSSTSGGGGKVEPLLPPAPRLVLPPASEDDDIHPEDYEDRYGLWHPPQPEPVTIPDNVADITPSAQDSPPLPPADPTTPLTPPAADPTADPTTQRTLSGMWQAMPQWMRIAAPTALALLLVIAVAIAFTGGRESGAPDGPAPTAEAPPSSVAAPVDAPLMPKAVTADCPAGSSSNPGLVFGADKSQAWVCTRIYNVENSVLTITFNQPVVISSIFVVPGFDYVESNGEDHWNEHRLVTQILWRIGGTQMVQKISPNRAGATMSVANIATQVITATIQKTERPAAVPNDSGPLPGLLSGPDSTKVDESFAIGHITITGRPAGGAT